MLQEREQRPHKEKKEKKKERKERKGKERKGKKRKRKKAPTPSFLATSVSAPCTAFSLFSGYPCFFSEVNVDCCCAALADKAR